VEPEAAALVAPVEADLVSAAGGLPLAAADSGPGLWAVAPVAAVESAAAVGPVDLAWAAEPAVAAASAVGVPAVGVAQIEQFRSETSCPRQNRSRTTQ
jgi:hypothetical protein